MPRSDRRRVATENFEMRTLFAWILLTCILPVGAVAIGWFVEMMPWMQN